MPATNFPEYAQSVSNFVNGLVATGQVARTRLDIDQRSPLRGMLSGILVFNDESELHLRAFVDATPAEPQIMYVYHYQDKNTKLVFRYDNTTHRPALSQTAHKHDGEQIELVGIPSLEQVVAEILNQ